MRYFLVTFVVVFLASCGKDNQSLTPEEYISQKNLQAQELDNGVYIVVHDSGNDIKATFQDVIEVSYIGKLTDDVVFDSSNDFRALLGDLIPGWFIGLQEIGEGGSCTLVIPYNMAFGEIENGPIPGKSTVVFDIELKKIYNPLTVDEYISENGLNTTQLDKGVHIAIQNEGNEIRPNLVSDIIVSYTGMMTNTLIFDQGENIPLTMSNLIEGWQIGLQEIGEGGVCTLVLPAEVAYGSNQTGSIPPNSPLVFEIELIKVD
jgi:FKBP-type peptidyl-prolyl cis-trans isomerase